MLQGEGCRDGSVARVRVSHGIQMPTVEEDLSDAAVWITTDSCCEVQVIDLEIEVLGRPTVRQTLARAHVGLLSMVIVMESPGRMSGCCSPRPKLYFPTVAHQPIDSNSNTTR